MISDFRTVATDLVMVESPRWHDDRLVFCDWGTGEVLALGPDGRRTVLARVEGGMPLTLDRLPDGRPVVLTQQGLCTLSDGTLTAYADLGDLSPHLGTRSSSTRAATCTRTTSGTSSAVTSRPVSSHCWTRDGPPRVVADGLAFPNGMAVTPDGATLLMAESYAGTLTAYAIGPDGSLCDRWVWAEVPGSAPDGICVDAEGAVWFAEVPGQRCLQLIEGGEVQQTLHSDLGCFSCALGGPDRRTLYVTAASWSDEMAEDARTGAILAATVAVPGA